MAFHVSLRTSEGQAEAPFSDVAPVIAQKAPGKKGVIKLDEISVEGRIQKPQAFYILPRSGLNFTSLDPQEAGARLRKIVRSTDAPEFDPIR